MTINAPRDILDRDLEPFRSTIDAGVPMVMLATAIYPAFGSEDPAAWSAPIVGDVLRGDLAFDGVAITDDLESPAVASTDLTPDEAAVRSIEAGVDLVLFAKSTGASEDAYRTLLRRAESGQLARVTLETAYDRITELKDSLSGD